MEGKRDFFKFKFINITIYLCIEAYGHVNGYFEALTK